MADIESNWPFDSIVPTDDGAVQDVLIAFETQLDRIDVQADELDEQRFLQTATTYELEKLADEVGVARETGESDERLQFRATLAKAVSRSGGTIQDIGQLLVVLFGEDNVTRIGISAPNDAPVIELDIPSDILDECPLSRSELEDEIGQVVPVGDRVDIVPTDTFTLGESGSKGIGEGGLT